MAERYEAPEMCPICGHDHLLITRVRCPACGSAIEGEFEPRTSDAPAIRSTESPRRSGPLPPVATVRSLARFGRLARLSDEQLEFVEVFLRCRGVIKNVEDMLGVSYPTVKSRLNTVLEALGISTDDDSSPTERRRIRREILADLSAGRISADEAHELLLRTPAPADDTGNDD